jgi:tetratricopeptide (TPR) repeat protein
MSSGRSPEDVCRASPELLPAVIAGLRRVRAFEDEVAAMFPSNGACDRSESGTPTSLPTIPGYEVTGLLGRGGMGVVFRARDLSLDREVAIKLLQGKQRGDSNSARRFEDEARITAQLQHPGIPPVHELGTLPDGRSFLAMKLIEGMTLDALLDARRSLDEGRGRFVAVFEQVCQAVAYAHAHDVIHRDLKPANVMVGAFGEVQVMDWGLAKVLRGRQPATAAAESSPVGPGIGKVRLGHDDRHETLPHELLGTPAFMPPEQAIGAFDRVDARSDAYSLGGILCAILTGQPPFVAPTSDAARELAAHARLDHARSRLAACGAEPELVALCLRCLTPEPDQRPRDAGEVAAAVNALRVAAEARAEQAGLERVRAIEQGKRRRVLLIANGTIAVVLLAGLVASSWQASVAAQQRDEKHKAWTSEQRAREFAIAALRDMTDDLVESQMASGAQITDENRAFLRRIIEHYERFASIAPNDGASLALRAEGRARVGLVRHRLGELGDARTAFEAAVQLQRQLAAEFPAQPEARQALASSQHSLGIVLRELGCLAESEASHEAALSLQRQLLAEFPRHPGLRRELARSHRAHANLLRVTGRPAAAEGALGESARLLTQLAAEFPEHHDIRKDLVGNHVSLGILWSESSQAEKAEAAYRSALQIQQELAAALPTRVDVRQQLAMIHSGYGILLRDTGRPHEAGTALAKALAVHKQLAADFPSRPDLRHGLAKTHNNIGNMLGETGRPNEAEGEWQAALTLLEKLVADFPTRHEFLQDLAASYNNLGMTLRRARRVQEAEQAYTAALEVLQPLAAAAPSRQETRRLLARVHNAVGSLFGETGRAEAAEAAFGTALGLQQQLVNDFPSHPEFRQELARSHSNLGVLFTHTGREVQAEEAYRAVLTIRRQLVAESPDNPDAHHDFAGTAVNLALMAVARQDFAASRAHLAEAQPHHQAALKANPRHASYRQGYRNHLLALTTANAGSHDPEGALRAAEAMRGLDWDAPADAYAAARALAECIPIAAQADAPDAAREAAAAQYGDGAICLLRDAVDRGYRDAARLASDTVFGPLRERDDFRRLVADLAAKGK